MEVEEGAVVPRRRTAAKSSDVLAETSAASFNKEPLKDVHTHHWVEQVNEIRDALVGGNNAMVETKATELINDISQAEKQCRQSDPVYRNTTDRYFLVDEEQVAYAYRGHVR